MKKLAVAIVHYHLYPGGVTRVIERAVECLDDQVDCIVLVGSPPSTYDRLTPLTEPFHALEYAETPLSDPAAHAEDLRYTARCLLGREPDLWHIHNHSLGKNSFVPQLCAFLAEAGCRLLLQPHDFAEDGRPENYRLLRSHLDDRLNRLLYPKAAHVWYAPINYRDKAFLEEIGLPHVHALPNAVTPLEFGETGTSDTPTIVYPARAIRRKNIGEFILWSVLAPEGTRFISTLAPQNPTARPIYDEWVGFAEHHALPVAFNAGQTTPFPELIQQASALITTSIAEGFGLAFLEPWLEGKQLTGRKLPEITTDFEDKGVNLSSLYTTLPVPLEWVGEAHFNKTLEQAMRRVYETYERPWKSTYLEEARSAMVVDGQVDFGRLDEPMQRTVLEHLISHPTDRSLMPQLDLSSSPAHIEQNQRMVRERYSPEAYGTRLLSLYHGLAETAPGPVDWADTDQLLDSFLKPERFNLLRT